MRWVYCVIAFFFTGCGALHKSIKYSDLDVQTRMSSSVFLEPSSQRTIFVQVRNTSDRPELGIESDIIESLRGKGYKIVDEPAKAQYLLQANLLSVGRMRDGQDPFGPLKGGFGAAVGGAAVGAAAGALVGGTHSNKAMLAGGLLGGLVGTVSDAMVDVITYRMITDVQISEKSCAPVYESSRHTVGEGTSGNRTSSLKRTTNRKVYRTRVISAAQKANLKFPEATPSLRQGLIYSISGIF